MLVFTINILARGFGNDVYKLAEKPMWLHTGISLATVQPITG